MRKAIPILLMVVVAVTLSIGCASTGNNLKNMWESTMIYRVDNMKIIEGGHDNRGLVIRVPNPASPGESIIEAVLGWTRSWGAAAGIPVDENDSARFVRSGHMGAKADNVIGAEVDDFLLIEVTSGPLEDIEEAEE